MKLRNRQVYKFNCVIGGIIMKKDNVFRILTTIGSTVIACGWCDYNGLYYSEDNGKTWKK